MRNPTPISWLLLCGAWLLPATQSDIAAEPLPGLFLQPGSWSCST